jgi:integrase
VTAGFTWQALNALAFFFKQVCGVENPVFGVKLRKTGTRIPVVLSEPETQEVFEQLESSPGGERYELAARLQYGAGLRRSELVRLRVKDVDLERGILTVRQGKGRVKGCASRDSESRSTHLREKTRDRRFYVGSGGGTGGSVLAGGLGAEIPEGREEF